MLKLIYTCKPEAYTEKMVEFGLNEGKKSPSNRSNFLHCGYYLIVYYFTFIVINKSIKFRKKNKLN